MRAVILAAGEGRRLGALTTDRPKSLVDVGGRPILERQLEALSGVTEDVLVAVGHGVDPADPRETIERTISVPTDVDLQTLYVPEWAERENAWTCYRALTSRYVDEGDDVLLVCGDVLFSSAAIRRFVQFAEAASGGTRSAVAAVEEYQDEMTAVRWDEEGTITDYGEIAGYREAGLFVLAGDDRRRALRILESNPDAWFPIVFPRVDAKRYVIGDDEQVEINTPAHLSRAERMVPL